MDPKGYKDFRACRYYADFLYRTTLLKTRLLEQGFVATRLKSFYKSYVVFIMNSWIVTVYPSATWELICLTCHNFPFLYPGLCMSNLAGVSRKPRGRLPNRCLVHAPRVALLLLFLCTYLFLIYFMFFNLYVCFPCLVLVPGFWIAFFWFPLESWFPWLLFYSFTSFNAKMEKWTFQGMYHITEESSWIPQGPGVKRIGPQ